MKKNLLLVFAGCALSLAILSFKTGSKSLAIKKFRHATPVADTIRAIKDSTFNIHRNLFDLLDKSKARLNMGVLGKMDSTTGGYRTFSNSFSKAEVQTLLSAKEATLTFSTGLVRSSNTITNRLSTGVSGGQSVIGGTASGDDLTLSSTSHATKGNIFFGSSTYDEVNDRLGIGTNAPQFPVHFSDGTAVTSAIVTASGGSRVLSTSGGSPGGYGAFVANNTPGTRASFFAMKARGTVTSPLAVATDDVIGDMLFGAYDGSTMQNSAGIFGYSDGTPVSGNNAPVRVSIVTGSTGSNRKERLTVGSNGYIGVGTTAPQFRFHFSDGNAVSSTFATNTDRNRIWSTKNSVNGGGFAGFTANDTVNGRSNLLLQRARGTVASPSAVATDDMIGDVVFGAYDGSTMQNGAGIFAYADGTPISAGGAPIRLSLVTGSTAMNRAERLTVKSSGNVGLGTTSPTALFHIKAGTTTAGTAPFKYTSGSLLTTSEAGAKEFLTDKEYLTITTGAARKEITLNDAALNSGIVPVTTTNGRLTNTSVTTAELGYLSGVTSAIQTQLNAKPSTSTTVAGFPLSSNVTLGAHSLGYGLSGSSYNGSAAQTWAVDTTSSTGLVSKGRFNSALSLKVNDADVVHKTGNETIAGNKRFTGLTKIDTLDLTAGKYQYFGTHLNPLLSVRLARQGLGGGIMFESTKDNGATWSRRLSISPLSESTLIYNTTLVGTISVGLDSVKASTINDQSFLLAIDTVNWDTGSTVKRIRADTYIPYTGGVGDVYLNHHIGLDVGKSFGVAVANFRQTVPGYSETIAEYGLTFPSRTEGGYIQTVLGGWQGVDIMSANEASSTLEAKMRFNINGAYLYSSPAYSTGGYQLLAVNNDTHRLEVVSGTGGGYGVPYTGATANVDLGTYNLKTTGNLSIGADPVTGYKLAVNGSIIAEGVRVKPYGEWPDYVFNASYKLPSLASVEKFIHTNKHLPDVPSAEEVKKDGHDLGSMDAVLLKKIEELTLYIIDLKKEVEALKTAKAEAGTKQD